MAQGAIQGAHYVTTLIKHAVKGQDDPANRKPFKYFDKGSMALISRYSAVAKVGKLEFGGFIAWLAWLLLHLYYLIGHRNRIAAMFAWGISSWPHLRPDGHHQPDDVRTAGGGLGGAAGAGGNAGGRRTHRSGREASRLAERLVDVGDQVVGALQPDGDPDHAVPRPIAARPPGPSPGGSWWPDG